MSVSTHRPWVSTLLLLALFFLSLPAATAAPKKSKAKRFVMVLDPGHGGRDVGAMGLMSYEKDINLNIALTLGEMIEKNCPDVKVIYTRKTDQFISLQERANIANRNKADLFISIHTNAVPELKELARGASTYTLGLYPTLASNEVAQRENAAIFQERNYKRTYKLLEDAHAQGKVVIDVQQDRDLMQSIDFARFVQQEYGRVGRKNMGVLQAGFLVLKATHMPSVLTEVGFISHPEEERYLNSERGVKQLAKSLYDGFRTYRRQFAKVEYPAVKLPNYFPNDNLLAMATPQSGKKNSGPAAPNDPPQRNNSGSNERLKVNGVVPEVKPVNTKPFPKKDPAATIPAKTEATKPETPNAQPAKVDPKKAEEPKKKAKEPKKKVEEAPKKTDKSAKKEEEAKKKAEPTPPANHKKSNEKKAEATAQTPAKTDKQAGKKDKAAAKPEKTPVKPEKTDSTAKRNKPIRPAKGAAKIEKADSTQKKAPTQPDPKKGSNEGKTKTSTTPPADPKTDAKGKKTNDKTTKTEPTNDKKKVGEAKAERPIFKVQILASTTPLDAKDAQFKGLSPIDHYRDGAMHKYTHGASTDFNAIRRLRTSLTDRFPAAFVVVFYQGRRISIDEANRIAKAAPTSAPAKANAPDNKKKK